MPRLRGEKAHAAVRRALCRAAAAASATFRVVQYSLQENHVHLIVEAESALALSRGVQGLEVRLARGLNRTLGRKGALFGDRYHAVRLTSPAQVRNALCYVLNNARRHAAQSHATYAAGWIDPYSSAAAFYGSQRSAKRGARAEGKVCASACACPEAESDLTEDRRPVLPPRTWLLSTGWRRHGWLSRSEIPGSAPAWLPRG